MEIAVWIGKNVLFVDREMALKSIKIQVNSKEFENEIRNQKLVW